jgi:Osmosensitive K+ channel histidine kinase
MRSREDFTESEYSIAQWVFKHSKKAGKYLTLLSLSEYTFYPLKGMKTKAGVVAIKPKKKFNGETELFWDTFLTQISNTLEHHDLLNKQKKQICLTSLISCTKHYSTLYRMS